MTGGFVIGAGLAIAAAFMLLPEINDWMKGGSHATRAEEAPPPSRSIAAPRHISPEEDERISASKNYQAPSEQRQRWRERAEAREICEYIPEWDDVVCHVSFERPYARQRQPQPYGGCPRRGGCPQPRQPQDDPEEPVTIQSPSPGYTVARMQPQYEYGPPIFGSDGRWHRTRRLVR